MAKVQKHVSRLQPFHDWSNLLHFIEILRKGILLNFFPKNVPEEKNFWKKNRKLLPSEIFPK